MSIPEHPVHDTLSRFIEGALDSDQAIEIATHVDECPLCAAESARMDPYARLWAAADDPPVPEGLVEDILAADAGTGTTPVAETVEITPAHLARLPREAIFGAVLLAAASLMAILGIPDPLNSSGWSTSTVDPDLTRILSNLGMEAAVPPSGLISLLLVAGGLAIGLAAGKSRNG